MTRADMLTPVTVVISTLDRPVQLERCLTALARGTRRPVAVVVVDQGTRLPATAVIEQARTNGLPVSRVAQQRWGLSSSQNAGVRSSTTDVVAIVDDDCVPDPNWLAVITAVFDRATTPLLLTGRVLPLPPDGERTAAVSIRDSIVARQWSRTPLPWEIGTGGNFAVTRAAFEQVGGNDERLGTGTAGKGANDLDLFDRLVSAGVTARYEPEVVVRHDRSTQDEYLSRRRTYGFGVGAMVGLWLRSGRVRSVPVLAGWVRLRLRVARERRTWGGMGHEWLVLSGTAAGLVHGCTTRAPRRIHDD